MKNFLKRMTAVMLVAMMVLGMAYAADITITANDSATHTYEAYQIFAGTVVDGKLGVTGWGDGVDGPALLNALKADETLSSTFDSCTDAVSVATKMASWADDSAEAEAFAAIVADNLSGTVADSGTTDDNGSVTLELDKDGYYLVKDMNDSVTGEGAVTEYILKVVGEDITIEAKSAIPSLEKNASKEYVVPGSQVEFTLTASLPDNYEEYETYKLVFTDSLTATNATLEYVDEDADGVVDITVSNTTASYTVVMTEGGFTVTFDNITTDDTVTKDTEIVITYMVDVTEVNGAGAIGTNVANLQYSNNPNADGDGEESTGTTPDVSETLYSLGLEINKLDEDGNLLDGATFALRDAGGYWLQDDGTLGDRETRFEFEAENGKYVIYGLSEGIYFISEVSAPEGYNLLTSEVEVSITAPTDGSTTYITVSEIENKKGSTLPSTGGMGTTILYIVGGILVVGAGVTLIVRKRMQNEAE